MRKETIVDQIEVRRNGNIQVRFGKLIVNADGTLAAEPQWHRAVFEPDTDIEAEMTAINAHLVAMNEAPVEATEIARIVEHATVARSPEVMEGFARQQAEKAAALKSA